MHGIGMFALSEGYIIKVYDDRRNVLWDAEACDMKSCMNVMGEITARMKQQYPQTTGEFTSQEIPLVRDGLEIGAVSVSYYGPYFLNEEDAYFLAMLNTILYSIGALALSLAAVAGILWARRISRPIHNAALAVDRIAGGQYEARMAGATGTRETDALARSVNQLATSIEQQQALRKQLTSDVAHELRTPLTTLQTHLEAMLLGMWQPTPERLQSNLDEVTRLSKIVADLESLSTVESGALKLQKEDVHLKRIAEAAVGGFEAETGRLRLHITVEGSDVVAYADPDRMTQVLVNLLSNAIKYTPEGGEIAIRLAEENSGVSISVQDTGSGIAQEDLPFVFERFYRADKSRNRATGGSGIGLAIVKSIVEAHGGVVEVQSKQGEGSSFRVWIP